VGPKRRTWLDFDLTKSSPQPSAVNAFTEAMAVELAPFGVRARLVLPGQSPETRFRDNAQRRIHGFDHAAYADLVKQTMARLGGTTGPKTRPLDVADAVWRAATDPSCPMQIAAGVDAKAWAAEVAAK
jgi:NAD(P)-dependent dehydrogenase (short-subunit alcohol dehydrogenase family)